MQREIERERERHRYNRAIRVRRGRRRAIRVPRRTEAQWHASPAA